ncbi:AraC family transcriptional regulator [Ruegeria sediminis]|nr:AraC family transcriptional regulator [Ruegeria sediminis]
MLVDRVGERGLHKAFKNAGLPLTVMDTPRAAIPLNGLAVLWKEAARATGDRTFGFVGGKEMTVQTYGLWLEYCASAPTFREALARIPKALGFHQSGTQFTFRESHGVGVLRYYPAWPGRFPQHTDHIVGSLVRFAAIYCGPRWRPAWVELDYARDTSWRTIERKIEAPLVFGATTLGIAVSSDDLKKPLLLKHPRALTLADVAAEAALATSPHLACPIANAIAFRLLDGKVDIDGAAALCGIGVQGLQRRLRMRGVSYRDLLKKIRMRRAVALLTETDQPISEIALRLGYEEHPNFSRAFRRSIGKSPSEFRR